MPIHPCFNLYDVCTILNGFSLFAEVSGTLVAAENSTMDEDLEPLRYSKNVIMHNLLFLVLKKCTEKLLELKVAYFSFIAYILLLTLTGKIPTPRKKYC